MLHFATGNTLKFWEAAQLIPGLMQFECELDEVQAIDTQVVVEDKLRQLREIGLTGAVLVEDTGLAIESLAPLPGALIKWFVTGIGTQRLADLSARGDDGGTRAFATSVVGCLAGGRTSVFSNTIEGSIVSPRGGDFGWNAIFKPLGSRLTFGEMSQSERLGYSMRAEPLRHAAEWCRRAAL